MLKFFIFICLCSLALAQVTALHAIIAPERNSPSKAEMGGGGGSGFDELISGVSDTATGLGLPMNGDATAAIDAWALIINSLLAFGGIIFLVVIIYGGWLWMTAAGNSDAVAKGKQLMLQASIGMIILLGARIIVEFVLYNVPTKEAAPATPTTGGTVAPSSVETTGGADDGGWMLYE